MSSEKLAVTWAGFYQTAFAGGAALLAAGRPLKIGYVVFEDLHEYADKIASLALEATVDIATEVRGAPPPPPAPVAPWDTPDDVPF